MFDFPSACVRPRTQYAVASCMHEHDLDGPASNQNFFDGTMQLAGREGSDTRTDSINRAHAYIREHLPKFPKLMRLVTEECPSFRLEGGMADRMRIPVYVD